MNSITTPYHYSMLNAEAPEQYAVIDADHRAGLALATEALGGNTDIQLDNRKALEVAKWLFGKNRASQISIDPILSPEGDELWRQQ